MALKDLFAKKDQSQRKIERIWSNAPTREAYTIPDLYHKNQRLDGVSIIARTIGTKPRYMESKGEKLEGHEFLDLLDTPDVRFPELDGNTIIELTVAYRRLIGECFWVLCREGSRITSILIMPPAWCLAVPTEQLPFFQFMPFGTVSNAPIRVQPQDVCWFKNPNILDPYGRGRGRTEAIGQMIDADEYAETAQKNYFFNDMTPPYWVNIPDADKTQLDSLQKTLAQRIGGFLNVRKPVFTNAPESVTIQKLGDTGKEADFIETRRFFRDEALHHDQIPPEIMGILESSNRATIDSADYFMAKNVLAPECSSLCATINRQIVHPNYSEDVDFVIDPEIHKDEAFRLQVVQAGLSSGALTRADWKREMGFDVTPADDVYIIPFSLTEVPAGQAIPPKVEPPAPIVDPIKKEKSYIEIKAPESWKEKAYKRADLKSREHEKLFIDATKKFAGMQKKRVLAAYPEWEKAFDGADEAMKRALALAWIETMDSGAKLAADTIDNVKKETVISWGDNLKVFNQWVDKYGLMKARSMTQTTKDKIAKIIAKSMEDGGTDSIAEIEEKIAGVFDELATTRAMLIARTETMASINFGQITEYASQGIENKEWLATMDNDTRDTHLKMDGQVVGMNEPFITENGDELAFPCDPSGPADETIQCRCTILPVYEDG
jgi:SPP1 gp7 family putative phage head morphogenesis protein